MQYKLEVCELCLRQVSFRTKHHLIPRTTHKNKVIKREHTPEERGRVAWTCRDCHRTIHALFSEKTLAREFHTLDDLRAHDEMARFLDWIKNKPEGAAAKPRHSKSRR